MVVSTPLKDRLLGDGSGNSPVCSSFFILTPSSGGTTFSGEKPPFPLFFLFFVRATWTLLTPPPQPHTRHAQHPAASKSTASAPRSRSSSAAASTPAWAAPPRSCASGGGFGFGLRHGCDGQFSTGETPLFPLANC